MKYTKEDIARVRDLSIAAELGVPMTGRKTMINCPMPNHNDGSPSFLIDDDNGFYCFGCGAKGRGLIDFLTQFLTLEGKTKEEAFIEIMNEYNGNSSN
jgi:DNA primase